MLFMWSSWKKESLESGSTGKSVESPVANPPVEEKNQKKTGKKKEKESSATPEVPF